MNTPQHKPRKWKTVYETSRPYESSNTSRIADRILDESRIDLLISARNKFKLVWSDVAAESGINKHILNAIIQKTRYCRKAEYTIIYDTMIEMICDKLGMSPHEALCRIRAQQQKE